MASHQRIHSRSPGYQSSYLSSRCWRASFLHVAPHASIRLWLSGPNNLLRCARRRRKDMRGRSLFLVLAFLFFTSAAEAQPAAAQAGTFEARVEEFLRQSGQEYHKVKANSWYLLVNGKEMGQIRIILGAGPGSIAMGAVVVPKQKMKLSAEALQKLMKLSYDLNYV